MLSGNSHKHISPSTRFVVNTPKPTRGGTRCTYTLHLRWSEFVAGSRAAVASKGSEYPNELRGVKSLLSGLPIEFSILAKALSRTK